MASAHLPSAKPSLKYTDFTRNYVMDLLSINIISHWVFLRDGFAEMGKGNQICEQGKKKVVGILSKQ